jgi:hypothetical protein
MKITALVLVLFMFSGCSTHSWERTQGAFMNAATDPVTWAPLVTGAVLDSTSWDDDLTDSIYEENEDDRTFSEDDADSLRTFTTVITYSTAIFVDENLSTKAKRVAVQTAALYAGRASVTAMNNYDHTAPNGYYTDALGSNHAVTPFASAALTRRNLEGIDIPMWSKYSINTVSYLAATGSAYERVEQGLHSVADQMYSISAGNFIALFINDAFMESDYKLGVEFNEDTKLTLNIPF